MFHKQAFCMHVSFKVFLFVFSSFVLNKTVTYQARLYKADTSPAVSAVHMRNITIHTVKNNGITASSVQDTCVLIQKFQY
jgi:hypothetical protein